MDYLQVDLGLPHCQSRKLCHCCPAGHDPLHTDYRPGAPWRTAGYNLARMKEQPYTQLPIFKIPGVSPFSVAFDSMHVVDLGTTFHCLGNVMFELVMDSGLSRTAGTAALWERCQTIYGALGIRHDHRVNSITFARFGDEKSPYASYPQLHGIKARAARYLVPVMAELAEEKVQTPHGVYRALYVRALAVACDLMDKYLLYMPADDHGKLERAVSQFLCHYA